MQPPANPECPTTAEKLCPTCPSEIFRSPATFRKHQRLWCQAVSGTQPRLGTELRYHAKQTERCFEPQGLNVTHWFLWAMTHDFHVQTAMIVPMSAASEVSHIPMSRVYVRLLVFVLQMNCIHWMHMISFNLRVVSVAWGQARWAFQPFFEVWLVKPKQTASALRCGATKRQGR
jgi:hypothetical protein